MSEWQHLRDTVLLYLPRLTAALAIIVVFWIGARAVKRFAQRLIVSRPLDADLTQLLTRVAKSFLLLCGAIMALGTLGINVTALVAGLGLTGFALGFALKDIISNALSGILVIMYKPFKNGDRIWVTALEGTVTDVNLRYTVLHADGKRIFVPNSSLMTNPITVALNSEVSLQP